MRVIVTGSRGWSDAALIEERLRRLPPDATIIHGDARRGVDLLADRVARRLGFDVVREPADWRVKPDTPPGAIRRSKGGPYDVRAGHLRNVRMFDKHGPIDLVLGFRLNRSGGATHCINEARRRGVLVEVVDR